MTVAERPVRRPALGQKQSRRVAQLRREASQLRTRRARRLAVEQAGVKRRLVLAGVIALALVALLVLPAVGTIGWAWSGIPAGLEALVIAYSLVAARHSAKLRDEEADRMQDILAEIADIEAGRSTSDKPDVASTRVVESPAKPASKVKVREESAVAPAVEVAKDEAEVRDEAGAKAKAKAGTKAKAKDEVEVRDEAEVEAADSAEEPAPKPAPTPRSGKRAETIESAADVDEVPDAPALVNEEKATDTTGDEAPVERRWSARTVPAPTYQRKAVIRRRQVHPDTDIKGFPALDDHAAVPARPVETSLFSGARSSADIASSLPVAFDLDDVLANRRAQ